MDKKYTKTTWENGKTRLNATNLNHIEDGIETLYNEALDKNSLIPGNGVKIDKVDDKLSIGIDIVEVTEHLQASGYVEDPDYIHTDNNFTDADKTKLEGIDMTTKQDVLESGTNIKTINNQSILGSGNIEIEGVSDYNELTNKPSINGTTLEGNVNLATPEQLSTKQDTLVSGNNIKTINNQSLLGSGNIEIEQHFESGESVNSVSIINDLTTGGEHDVLSAEAGKESVKDLNSVIGTGTLKNLVDTLITGWTKGRYGLLNRGFADAEYYVRFNSSATGYSVSNEFDVKKGTIIEFDHGSESTIVSQSVILIVKVEEGSDPTAILMSDNLNDNNTLVGITEYRFVVPYDMTIRLGTRNPYNNNSFYKIYESSIQVDNDLVRTTYPIAFSSADEYRDLMSQATKVDSYNGSDSELSTGWKDTQVTLLHYSDIHGDLDRLKRILEFRERYSTPESIIDDIICTGDMCGSKYANYNEAFDTLPGYNRVLQVIGNHDVYDADGTHGNRYDSQDYYATEQQKYERYMANASTWGVVKPSGAGENGYYPCYYYKDYVANRTYASNNAYKQKVRLIVLDAMIKTTDTELDIAQKKWFAETLFDAKTNGKHVVVADHFSYRDNDTNHFEAGGFDCMIDEWGERIGNFGIKMKTYAEIVNYYINGGTCTIDGVSYDFGTGGGEFVCWLCGHFHWDMVGTTTTYPEQVFIAVGSANFHTPMQHRARVVGEESEDLFNIVSVDTFRRHIRVFRIGAKWDRFLEHAGTMCISYDSRNNAVPHLISHF